MNETLIVYCAFMYLLTAGMVGAGVKNNHNSLGSGVILAMAINFIFAPLATPIILGILIYDNTIKQ